MATKTPAKAAKTKAPRLPSLKQLIARTQAIDAKVNELLTLLRRIDGEKGVITTPASGLPKNITGGP
jgi:hypothetical protein